MSATGLFYAFALVLVFVVYISKMWKFYYASFKMKGPTGWPLIGNALEFVGSGEDLYETITRLLNTYSTPMRIWIGTNFIVTTTDPEDFKLILNNSNCITKISFYDFTATVSGNSILTTKDVSRWRLHRKLLEPTFRVNILNSFIPIFEKHALNLCEKLESLSKDGTFDVFQPILICTLDTILETVMGLKKNVQFNNDKYANCIIEATALLAKRMFNIWYHPDFIYKFTEDHKRFNEYLSSGKNHIKFMIQAKDAEYKKNKHQNKQNEQKVLLDYLMELLNETGLYTEGEVSDEIVTFFVAGSHSTALTSGFALMLLGMHPEIQDKVYDELVAIFGDSQRTVTKSDLDNMHYLQRVIKETMRIFPFAPFIGRTTTQDIQLSTCFLPKGSDCALGIFLAHRDPKLWPNPLKFDPDRFLPEEVAKRHPYAWIPFSAGPRNCIGIKYAKISLRIILSTIIRRYRVYCEYKCVEEIRLKLELAPVPIDGYRIALKARKTPK